MWTKIIGIKSKNYNISNEKEITITLEEKMC